MALTGRSVEEDEEEEHSDGFDDDDRADADPDRMMEGARP
jgi:hypothetical protein